MALLEKHSILEILNDQDLSSEEVDQLLDKVFGLTFEEGSSDLEHSYPGLDTRALLTSYRDYYSMMETLSPQPGTHFFEPGAGYFRAFFLFSILYPEVKYTGIEQVESRVLSAKLAARSLHLPSNGVRSGDALEMQDDFDFMFLYLPSTPLTQKLIQRAKKRIGTSIIAIESHGDLIPLLEGQRNSLKLSEIVESESPRHRDGIFVYQVTSFEKDYADELLEVSDDKTKCFLIEEESEQFLIPTKDSWFSIQDNHLTTAYPIMEIKIQNIIDILTPDEDLIPWHHLRFSNEPDSKVRKIITKPEPMIEFVLRGRVPLKELQV
ncbi:MAG: hypothetical protein EP319_18605 [Deltaproteobacteria bacterium]|nr:MAG: hypothetical protein EP319_18605 [Deltaproteobacteria bacterium]